MTQKLITAGKELQQNLRIELAKLEAKQAMVEARQAAGDFSAETARLLNIISNKLLVTRNRLESKQLRKIEEYRCDRMVELPKVTRK